MHRLSLVLLLLVAVAGASAAESGRTGILYLEEVFRQATFLEKASQGLQEQARSVNEVVEKIGKDIENTQRELEVLLEKDPKRAELLEDIEVKKLRRKLLFERSRKQLDRAEMALLARSYLKIREVLDSFAEAKGYDLILLATPAAIGSRTLPELRLELATHAVLHHRKQADITADFLAYLNEQVTEPVPPTGTRSGVELDVDPEEAEGTEEATPAETTPKP